MTAAADQIAEINARFAERVKLLERERDAKIRMVQSRCPKHRRGWRKYFHPNYGPSRIYTDHCVHCGAPMQ